MRCRIALYLPAEVGSFCFAVTVADAGLLLRMPLGNGESSVAAGGLTCDDGWRGWVDCTGLLDFRKLFPVKNESCKDGNAVED